MRKLVSILLSFCLFTSVFANHTIVGSGSGTFSVSSMSGKSPGDTIFVTAGTYGGSGFTNLVGIVILPLTPGHTVFFTAELGFRNVDSCELGYFTFTGISGNAIDMRAYGSGRPYTGGNGPISHCYLHHLAFYNISTSCIDANGGLLYVPGDTTRYCWYKNIMDSIFEFQCDNFCQGSFGSPTDNSGNPPNVMDQITISHFISLNTTSTVNQGVEIRGIIFEYNFHDWHVFDTSGRGNSGDCGLTYGHGTGTMYNIYKWGGPGYVVRMAPTKEVGRPGISREYNICKTNSTDYGVIQHQNPDSVAGAFSAVDSINVWNITGINMATDNTYWCQDVVLGDMSCTGGVVWMYAHIKNCLAINVADAANGGAGHDMGTGTIRVVFNMGTGGSHTDTANNQYFWTMTAARLDSTTILYSNVSGNFPEYRPVATTLGNILHGGTTNPFTSVDYLGAAMRTPPDIGYVQFAAPGAPCTNCLPKYKWTKQIFR